MAEFIVDVLAVYGGYTLAKNYWNANKKAIISSAANCIIEAVKENLSIDDPNMAINIKIGGKE